MTEKVVGYKLTRPALGGWIHAGVTPKEVADALTNELDLHEGLSAEECDEICITAYETTQGEIDSLPEFDGW